MRHPAFAGGLALTVFLASGSSSPAQSPQVPVKASPVPVAVPKAAPQAPGKAMATPLAPSKMMPMPYSPSKVMPAAQAPPPGYSGSEYRTPTMPVARTKTELVPVTVTFPDGTVATAYQSQKRQVIGMVVLPVSMQIPIAVVAVGMPQPPAKSAPAAAAPAPRATSGSWKLSYKDLDGFPHTEFFNDWYTCEARRLSLANQPGFECGDCEPN